MLAFAAAAIAAVIAAGVIGAPDADVVGGAGIDPVAMFEEEDETFGVEVVL